MEETLQPKMKKEKLFKWALWWGIGIVVACLAILIIKGASSEEFESPPMMNAFYDIMYKFGILPLVIFIGIIAPVYEEFAFRLWGNGKLWTGILSTILMAVVTYIFLRWWWFSLLVIMCGAFIIYYFRNDKKKKLFYLMLLSSAAFAIAHKGNYGDCFTMIVAVVHKFGFGLLASYLVINYNLFWAMVLHAANNTVLAIPLFFAFNSINGDVKVIENEDFRLEMRTVLVEDKNVSGTFGYDHSDRDTCNFYGNTAAFAHQAMYYDVWKQGCNPNIDTLVIAYPDFGGFPKCFFNIVFKTEPNNHHRLLKTLNDDGLIKIDTTVKPANILKISNQSKLIYEGKNDTLINIRQLVRSIRVNSMIPIYPEEFPNYKIVGGSLYDSLYVKGVEFRKTYTIEELREILEPQGIVIEPSDRTMTIINIKNTYNPLKDL